MIVAEMTQYLAKAQEMPTQIKAELQRMTRNFIWKDAATSPINFNTLTKSIQEGDIKLLDLKARNEAIELTWLRSYLDLSKIRTIWAYIADVLIARSVASLDRNTIYKIRNNVYL